jgi:hypothetical protein
MAGGPDGVLTAHFFAYNQIAGEGLRHFCPNQLLNREVSLCQHIVRTFRADLQLGSLLEGQFAALARQADGKVQPGGQVSG